uniref:Beta-defensin n=1 Tax=Pseudonaja textilis TaxID=8673 RepID=A0A670ZAJ1_PSETE
MKLQSLLFCQGALHPSNWPAPDTLECRSQHHGFCKRYNCPGQTIPTGGTCQWGTLICCKS